MQIETHEIPAGWFSAARTEDVVIPKTITREIVSMTSERETVQSCEILARRCTSAHVSVPEYTNNVEMPLNLIYDIQENSRKV